MCARVVRESERGSLVASLWLPLSLLYSWLDCLSPLSPLAMPLSLTPDPPLVSLSLPLFLSHTLFITLVASLPPPSATLYVASLLLLLSLSPSLPLFSLSRGV